MIVEPDGSYSTLHLAFLMDKWLPLALVQYAVRTTLHPLDLTLAYAVECCMVG